jgi:hypothetical protein
MPRSRVRFKLFRTEGHDYEHPRSLKYQSEPPPTSVVRGLRLVRTTTRGRSVRRLTAAVLKALAACPATCPWLRPPASFASARTDEVRLELRRRRENVEDLGAHDWCRSVRGRCRRISDRPPASRGHCVARSDLVRMWIANTVWHPASAHPGGDSEGDLSGRCPTPALHWTPRVGKRMMGDEVRSRDRRPRGQDQ